MNNPSVSYPGALVAMALATAFSTTAGAQSTTNTGYDIEEIVVTAQRRAERALDVPISITALSGEQLGKGDVLQLGDIMKLTPGLRFDKQGGNAQPTIRGVGSSVVMAGAGANIAIYTDGFYSPNPLIADGELFNIESIEVLKGPQGTLFGRNSTGGAILVNTKAPSSEAAYKLRASYSNYNAQHYSGYATGGPGENLAFDIGGVYRRGDGYLKNINTGDDKAGRYENWAIRLGALWTPSDKLSVLLRYTKADEDDPAATSINFFEDGGNVYSYAGFLGANVSSEPHRIANGHPFGYTSETESIQLKVQLDLDFATLTSYTQYRDEVGVHDYDFDASAWPIYHYHFATEDEIFTQEFLLSSSGDGRLQWTTGLFYMDNDTVYPENQASVGGGPFFPYGGTGIQANSLAVFGDLTYALTEKLFLTVGARYSEDELTDAYYIDYDQSKVPVDDVDDNKITPRIALRYALSDDSSIYASYAEGFKASMINLAGGDLLGVYVDTLEVDPEEIKAYEVGYKYSSGNFTLDAAAFYYDYKDLQAVSYLGADTIVNNAASSSVKGVEVQTRYAMSEQFDMNFGLALLDAEYDDYDESQAWIQCLDFVTCGTSYGLYLPIYVDGSGNEMQRSPEVTATLGARYLTDLFSGVLELSGNLYYTSDFYFDTSEAYEQDSYHLLSLRAAWTDPSDLYTIAIFGDNLTDQEYINSLLPQFYGALTTWGAPRTYGASIEFNF